MERYQLNCDEFAKLRDGQEVMVSIILFADLLDGDEPDMKPIDIMIVPPSQD